MGLRVERGGKPGAGGHMMNHSKAFKGYNMRYAIYHTAVSIASKVRFSRLWSGAKPLISSKFNDRYCGMCGKYYDSEKGHVCL